MLHSPVINLPSPEVSKLSSILFENPTAGKLPANVPGLRDTSGLPLSSLSFDSVGVDAVGAGFTTTTIATTTAYQPKKADVTLVLNLSGNPVTAKQPNTIYANDLESLWSYKAFLGDKCEISVYPDHEANVLLSLDDLLDPPALRKEDLADFSKRVSRTLRALPSYFDWLSDSPLALTAADTLPPAIQKTFVHKRDKRNVLISTPYKTGNLYWFNMFERSEEFRFDHESDHVQGMLLMEGLRQASIAAVHQSGLPLDGSLALLTFDIGFSSYVDHGYPILIRTFPYFDAGRQSKEPLALVVSQIFQKGRLCAEATVSGQAFFSAQEYAAVRERTVHIIDRQTKKFENALSRAQAA